MTEQPSKVPPMLRGFGVGLVCLLLVYALILAVAMVGKGFKWSAGGADAAAELFTFATNPVVGLIIGVFATALVQSSSTVTSVIVGLVAGGLPVQLAIPMIMGANIGTTVTNTLVSLGSITRPVEFRRAFAAATVHDVFNLLAVSIFLPIEIVVGALAGAGPLEWMSGWLADTVGMGSGVDVKGLNFVKPLTEPLVGLLHAKSGAGVLDGLGRPWGGIVMVLLALVLVFGSITWLGRLLKKHLTGRAEAIFHLAVGRGPISGIASGTVITVLVQSSSTTTSLIVPMAGSGVLPLERVLPFTLGANIGTTVTALLASTAGADHPALAAAALQIALVHLLFNTLSVIVVYGVPVLRRLVLGLAQGLASMAVRRRALAIAYVVVIYFAIPLLIIGIMELAGFVPHGAEAEAAESNPRVEVPEPGDSASAPDADPAAPPVADPSSGEP